MRITGNLSANKQTPPINYCVENTASLSLSLKFERLTTSEGFDFVLRFAGSTDCVGLIARTNPMVTIVIGFIVLSLGA